MKTRLKTTSNRREYRVLFLKQLYPPYYEEGWKLYPEYRKGRKNPHKQIMSYQVRMYKTWKHNRKTQWRK